MSGEMVEVRARQWVARIESTEPKEWMRGDVLDGQFLVEDLLDLLSAAHKEIDSLRSQMAEVQEGSYP
jgi:hypothetical protein